MFTMNLLTAVVCLSLALFSGSFINAKKTEPTNDRFVATLHTKAAAPVPAPQVIYKQIPAHYPHYKPPPYHAHYCSCPPRSQGPLGKPGYTTAPIGPHNIRNNGHHRHYPGHPPFIPPIIMPFPPSHKAHHYHNKGTKGPPSHPHSLPPHHHLTHSSIIYTEPWATKSHKFRPKGGHHQQHYADKGQQHQHYHHHNKDSRDHDDNDHDNDNHYQDSLIDAEIAENLSDENMNFRARLPLHEVITDANFISLLNNGRGETTNDIFVNEDNEDEILNQNGETELEGVSVEPTNQDNQFGELLQGLWIDADAETVADIAQERRAQRKQSKAV